MESAAFEGLLQKTIGLDAASIGSATVARAVGERLSACNFKELAAYWEHLRNSEGELQALVEAVVVPETWFFRDREAFAAMVNLVHREWLPRHPDGVLRVLSVPCSTGEEPYSIAMALADSGFPATRLRIDAVDISARSLARAKLATYGRNSFRGADLGFRDRHFERRGDIYHLGGPLRMRLQFRQGNLLDPNFLPGAELYDIIFCRNLMIYFDGPTQDRAIAVLRRLLTPDGVLFVGPAETSVLASHDFVSAKMPLAFAFRKANEQSKQFKPLAVVPPPRLLSKRRAVASPVVERKALTAPVRIAPPSQSAPAAAAKLTDLDEAQRLADQGRLAEAAQCCEEHLRIHGPSVKPLYLLALVRDASGDLSEAAGLYRKVLYLEPVHHEALLHLAFVLQRQGDAVGAKVLNDRARRLEREAAR